MDETRAMFEEIISELKRVTGGTSASAIGDDDPFADAPDWRVGVILSTHSNFSNGQRMDFHTGTWRSLGVFGGRVDSILVYRGMKVALYAKEDLQDLIGEYDSGVYPLAGGGKRAYSMRVW